jgi:hypothetical protein
MFSSTSEPHFGQFGTTFTPCTSAVISTPSSCSSAFLYISLSTAPIPLHEKHSMLWRTVVHPKSILKMRGAVSTLG